MRKRARAAGEELEQLAVQSALTAIRFAECVIVVIDATAPFEKQDLTIADMVAREGRAIVFAMNKWDQVEAPAGAITALKKHLDQLLPQIAGAPLVGISALTGEGVDRMLPAVLEADARLEHAACRRPSSTVSWTAALPRHPPPAIHGRRVRIRYMTQAKSPPADLCAVRHPARRIAGVLSALSAKRIAQGIQSEGRAAAVFARDFDRIRMRTSEDDRWRRGSRSGYERAVAAVAAEKLQSQIAPFNEKSA